MHLGLVGLGKMGGNMRLRLRDAGHTVVGYDRDPELADVGSLEELVEALPSPKVVWVMVPAGGPTHETVDRLGELLGEGDLVVDGGNSRWTDDQAHAAALAEKGIGFVDCGVSGGVWGRENGYALMYGGSAEDVAKVQPAFDALKPPGEFGSVHAGKVGAGHFSKMVHNGIEYAVMQSYAEGWELLQAVDVVDNTTEVFRRLRRRLGRGPLDRRGRHRERGRHAGHHRRALREVRLPPGRLARDEGGGGDAQPVRWSRHARGGRGRARTGPRPGMTCTSRT